MIEIECDNCERVFEVSPKQAGGKVPCPHCGDVNRVPPAEASQQKELPPRSRTSASFARRCFGPIRFDTS